LDIVESKGGEQPFRAPFKGSAVFYLTIPPEGRPDQNK
jgi:hypothetical protein